MYRAKQNLRAYNITYVRGEVYDAPLPEGYEKCFEKVSLKQKREIAGEEVETAAANPPKQKRKKK